MSDDSSSAPRDDWRNAVHHRLTQTFALPMLILSVGFLVVLIWPLAEPHMAHSQKRALDAADWGIWAAFAVEYIALLATAPDRRDFARRHILDLLVVLLPMLRPLRLVRSAMVLRLLRFGRLAAVIGESVRRSRTAFFSRAVVFALALGAILVLSAAAVILDLERAQPGANIKTFGDGLWWAMTTITTVGYGDRYPVTGAGRAIAAVLMVVGVAIVGVVTAAMAAWLVSMTQDEVAGIEERQHTDLQRIHEQLATLQRSVDALATELGTQTRNHGQ